MPEIPEPPRRLVVENARTGRRFEARVVGEGERYGLNDKLVNKGTPLVEFTDLQHNQFVSRYHLETLLADAERLCQSGLALDAGVEEWQLSAANMVSLSGWLRLHAAWEHQRQARARLPRSMRQLLRD